MAIKSSFIQKTKLYISFPKVVFPKQNKNFISIFLENGFNI